MFSNDLDFSLSQKEFWDNVYRKKFPDALDIFYLKDSNSQAQSLGIDTIIVLRSGAILKIEEKMRRVEYADILLEFESGTHTGWMEKEYLCDYLAYAFPSKVYFFPYADLKQIWRKKKNAWKKKFKVVEARNIGYTTKSIAVPFDFLIEEMAKNNLILSD